jgi:hypothetical protein
MISAKFGIGSRSTVTGGIPQEASPNHWLYFHSSVRLISGEGSLTKRERAFYSRFAIHVPCKIGATSVSKALNL